MEKKRICFVATFEMPVRTFLLDHFRLLSKEYDITLIAKVQDTGFLKTLGVDVRVISLGIERKIALLADIKALFHLFLIFRKERFEIVHSIMPKTGLLSMVAAFLAGIPIRIHTFTGQVWATMTGGQRLLLKVLDRALVACATQILTDGSSQRDFLIEEGIVPFSKVHMIANGSIAGVDTKRFVPDPEARRAVRGRLAIRESDIVFLYLGRINKDKGLLDLAGAFRSISDIYRNTSLLIVGPDEEGMKDAITKSCGPSAHRVYFEDYTDVPEQYMAAADVFCLPSYREGFGLAIIEAASAGIPAIGSRIYGITDAVSEGTTGLLFKVGSVEELSAAMTSLINHTSLRNEMGRSARERVIRCFSKELVTSGLMNFYNALFRARPGVAATVSDQ
jgi:glycosyltransferase involved in cell wall biosynthesis